MLLLTLALLASHAWAQAPTGDDDDDDGPESQSAMLTVHFNELGNARVTFYSVQDIQNWAPIQSALEQALHCPAGALQQPPPNQSPSKYIQSLDPKRRAQYENFEEQQRRHTLEGDCLGAMTRNELLFSTDISLASVLIDLKQAGQDGMWVTINYPKSIYSEHTPTTGPQPESAQASYLYYQFDAASSAATGIHLVFGLRRQDAIRSAAFPIVFLLSPILIMLWMQRAALRDAERDPTGAWFSYLRVLSWCGNGLLIVWMMGFSIRHGLEVLFSYQLARNDVSAVALGVAIFMLPPWIVYLICLLMSYSVYVRVRGEAWTRGEFLANQLLTVASLLLPLMCLIAASGMLALNARASMALFVGVFLTYAICTRLKLKVSGLHPEALTTGELRDRVFELAKKAVVEVRQVFIMPAGKSMMANAFASRNQFVIFTDYLLNRLDKREVIAVAAHEITHIQKKHVTWKWVGLMGLILSPFIFRGALNLLLGFLNASARHSQAAGGAGADFAVAAVALTKALSFPELDLIFYVVALGLYLLQSRSMERVADAGAVLLTQDPEAVITSLLKLGRLNLLPIQWGPVTGSLFTHPSMLKRVERVARLGQVAPDRLQQILTQYREMESQSASVMQPDQIFTESQTTSAHIMTTARASQSAINKSWILQILHIVPAALVAWFGGHWQGRERPLIYIAGAIACIAIYTVVAHWMGVWGLARLQREFKAALQAEGISIPESHAALVALSPEAAPRYYVAGFHWDTGYLFFACNRLCYAGDHVRFALRPEQVGDVRLGPGVPGWFPTPRIYVDWLDEASGTVRTWNVVSKMPCPFWCVKQQAFDLFADFERWRTQPSNYPDASPALKDLAPPSIGEVTSHSPQFIFAFGRSLRLACWIVLLAAAVCMIFRIPALWYVCLVVLLLRIYESLPFWFYKEPGKAPLPFVAASVNEIP
jgi:Zn-dependent protease with chaperone function